MLSSLRSKLSLVLALLILVASIGQFSSTNAQRRGKSRSAREAQKRTKTALAKKISEITEQLEKKDSTDFLTYYFDAKSQHTKTIAKRVAADSKERARLLRILKKFEQAELVINPRGDTATLFTKIKKEETVTLRPSTSENPEKTSDASGYGDNLSGAIKGSLIDLSNERYVEFIHKMYPEAELERLAQQDQEKHLIARLKQHVVIRQGLLNELSATLKLKSKPVEIEGRTVVSFQIPGDPRLKDKIVAANSAYQNIAKPPAREVRFELVNGNWRFFDGGVQLRKEMKRMSSGLAQGGGISIEWKRTAYGWRISSIPFF